MHKAELSLRFIEKDVGCPLRLACWYVLWLKGSGNKVNIYQDPQLPLLPGTIIVLTAPTTWK